MERIRSFGTYPLLRAIAAALLVAPALAILPSPAVAADRGDDTPSSKSDPVDRDGNDVVDSLDEQLDSAPAHETLDAIVLLDRRPTTGVIDDQHEDVGEFDVDMRYGTLDAYAASLTPDQIEELAARTDVVAVQPNAEMHATLDTATTEFGVREARLDFPVNGNTDGASSYSKNDVVIAVIDTGIDGNHDDLDVGKVLAFADFTADGTTCTTNPTMTSAYDNNGHGTHVSSIAAGEGQLSSAAVGVAPGAALVGVKVLSGSGSGSTCDVDAGIQWVINNKATYGIEVINLSLGNTWNGDGTDSTSQMVDLAVANGITVVVAAGNTGPASNTVGEPGVARDAITVGAMTDPRDVDGGDPLGFSLADFSSRGPTSDGRVKPDLAAAGVDIYAAKPGDSYRVLSGTSMASPFVAGVTALMLDANPSLTPAQVKSTLTGTAVDWGPAGADNDYGSGRLDAHAAVNAADPLSCAAPSLPTHTSASGSVSGTNDFDDFSISIPDTTWPLAVTLLMGGSGTNPDLDMTLRNPSGSVVATADGVARQEWFGYQPTTTGTYTLRVNSYSGAGSYTVDVSRSPSTGGGSDSCPPQPAFVPPTSPTPAPSSEKETATTTTTTTTAPPSSSPAPSPAPAPDTSSKGYVLIDDKGGLFSFGSAPFLGSVPGLKQANPSVTSSKIVGAFPTHGGDGYIAYDDEGRVFPFGRAQNLGSVYDRVQAKLMGAVKVVAGFATGDGAGYVLIDDGGGVHTFGSAPYLGSVPDLRKTQPIGPAKIVSGFPVDGGQGYVMIDNVGGLFAFGSAKFLGSVPALRNAGYRIGPATIIGGFSTGTDGYVMIDNVGGLFAFGTAQFRGSVPALREAGHRIGPAQVIGGFSTDNGAGYVMIDDAGGLFAFGSSKYYGSVPGLRAEGRGIGPAEVVGGFST
ncbi:MAG: S8 family serine peptidase [Actinobacteria bacterium]|nr:S8 family serine peptidase [Actinomycetota bacterium]